MHMEGTESYSLNLGGQLLQLSEPQVMGILNVTPDSFYSGSRRQTETEIAQRVHEIVREGGTIIDVGGYSTRPGAQEVGEEEELARLRLGLSVVRREAPEAAVSVDTFRARVAEQVADEFGPVIVNDVSGGADPEMFATVARRGLPYVLTLDAAPADMMRYLSQRVDALLQLGQKDIVLDPGFGFGKSLDENYQLLGQLEALHAFGLPLLVGVSRKSMVYRLLGTTPEEALNGTTVLHTLALERGASILRVHDVGAATEVIKILRKCSSPSD